MDYNDCITVGELKELLNEFDDDMPVGQVGRYAEVLEMTKKDFYVASANRLGKNIKKTARNIDKKPIRILAINQKKS